MFPISLVIVTLSVLIVPLTGQTQDHVELMPEREEIALALSAAPPHVSGTASVYVLQSTGFTLAREGDTGFACLVERSIDDPSVRAPQCYDPEAAATVMQMLFVVTRLRLAGKSEEEVVQRLNASIVAGTIRPPSRPSLGYRMSVGQYLGERVGRWLPHVRVYAPYLTNVDIGGSVDAPSFPFVFGNAGGPFAYIVIVVPDEIDVTP